MPDAPPELDYQFAEEVRICGRGAGELVAQDLRMREVLEERDDVGGRLLVEGEHVEVAGFEKIALVSVGK
ncbi:MAG: hypothetical protein R3F11_17275 [Verrucomicrobiales bacterium]